jgi:hypothetical protein
MRENHIDNVSKTGTEVLRHNRDFICLTFRTRGQIIGQALHFYPEQAAGRVSRPFSWGVDNGARMYRRMATSAFSNR